MVIWPAIVMQRKMQNAVFKIIMNTVKADRAYSKTYGELEDYRDGYQQGFESGYNTGFEKSGFDSTLPVEHQEARHCRGGTTTPAA